MPNLDYIWSVNEQKLTPMKRWRLRATKRLVIVVESITKNNLMSYASALTYWRPYPCWPLCLPWHEASGSVRSSKTS